MAKKRKKKTTVFGSIEGEKRERIFFDRLRDIYEPENNNIHITASKNSGGQPDKIIGEAIKSCHFNRSFAWLDEDFQAHFPLSPERKEQLCEKQYWYLKECSDEFMACSLGQLNSFNVKDRNPTIIVSQPICVEGLILKILDEVLPEKKLDLTRAKEQTRILKTKLDSVIGTEEEAVFYRQKMTKELLEAKRLEIKELDLLISMITN